MADDDELARLRAAMDEVNGRLVAALHDRARLCRAIGRWKRRRGVPTLDAEREAAMVAAVVHRPEVGGFSAEALRRIFAQVIAESRPLVDAD